MTNAKKDWIKVLRECCDALESVDVAERARALVALFAVYDGDEIARLRSILEKQR